MWVVLEFLFWVFMAYLALVVIAWISDNVAPSKDDTRYSSDGTNEDRQQYNERDF